MGYATAHLRVVLMKESVLRRKWCLKARLMQQSLTRLRVKVLLGQMVRTDLLLTEDCLIRFVSASQCVSEHQILGCQKVQLYL